MRTCIFNVQIEFLIDSKWCVPCPNVVEIGGIKNLIHGNCCIKAIPLPCWPKESDFFQFFIKLFFSQFFKALEVGIKIRWEWGPVECLYQVFCSSYINSTIGLCVHMSMLATHQFSGGKRSLVKLTHVVIMKHSQCFHMRNCEA